MTNQKKENSYQPVGIGTIFFAMAVVTFGPAIFHRLFSGEPPKIPPPDDPLKGMATPAALAAQIHQIVPEAEKYLVFNHRLFSAASMIPPAIAIVCIALIIVLGVREKRLGTAGGFRWLVLALSIFPFCVAISADIYIFTSGMDQTRKLVVNTNTVPDAIAPGEEVTITFAYSPQINSLAACHHFKWVKITSLTAATTTGKTISLTPELLGHSGDSGDDWESVDLIRKDLAVMPSVKLLLPNDAALENSLVSGTLQAAIDYLVVYGTDRIKNSAVIDGNFMIWVSQKSHATYANKAIDLEDTDTRGALINGTCLTFALMGIFLIIRHEKKARNPEISA